MTNRILNAKLSVILCYALLFVADNAGAQGSSPSSPDVSAAITSTGTLAPATTSEPVTETSESCILPNIMDYALTRSQTALITIPISSYTFSSFPVPSAPAIPGTFPSASPQSPPPPGSELIPDFEPAWASAHSRAQAFVSGLTLEQKVGISTGSGIFHGRCIGNVPALSVPESNLSWPGLCLHDAPLGVRAVNLVTAFPAGITVASTWNRTLLRLRGQAMGAEFRGKGINVALGPVMNMGRHPQGGRNWESFGADPYLTGESAYETVLGVQQAGVQACAKHYINKCVCEYSLGWGPLLTVKTLQRAGAQADTGELARRRPDGARDLRAPVHAVRAGRRCQCHVQLQCVRGL